MYHVLVPQTTICTPNRHSGSERNLTTSNSRTGWTARRIFRSASPWQLPKSPPVHVFIFSDLVLLVTKRKNSVRLIRSATTRLQWKKSSPVASYLLVDQVGRACRGCVREAWCV
ncbi:hypothetical protein VP01_3017g5 [Puccinia sorghi]|uniref:Uncharacterized protein n=1 Tax=Puccinia sorghi TaxID=27349 RepID=A0A0L6V1Z8_9BASI|nr:hypothetical protein VP01_3017g5 [Puccinia sorghi]